MRGWMFTAAAVAAMATQNLAPAVEPLGKLGKVTRRHERRIIGREERDNTFRRPGSILSQAKTPPQPVDQHYLRARQRAMVAGRFFTQPAVSTPVQGISAAPQRQTQPEKNKSTGGPSPALYAAMGISLGFLLILTTWFALKPHRRRRISPHRTSTPTPPTETKNTAPAKRRSWTDRELKITMGSRD